VLPAFSDVGAVRLLTDRVELQVAHHVLQGDVVRAARGLYLEPGGLSLELDEGGSHRASKIVAAGRLG
jgi:hypothetical protein